jgi:hypothetical protein
MIQGPLISRWLQLNQARTKSKFKKTDDIVSRLIAQSIETGAITAVAAGLELILFLVYQNNTLHDIPSVLSLCLRFVGF